jgi:hypothetical protein
VSDFFPKLQSLGAQTPKEKRPSHKLADIDVETRTATCATCGPVKVHNKGPGRYQCPVANKARAKSHYARIGASQHRERKYGLSDDAFKDLLRRQDNKCAIGDCPFSDKLRPHVDHDHETGAVRGLLCREHNSMLGYGQDLPKILRNGADYIERHKARQACQTVA